MAEAILSIEQVAEKTPWSASTLYREAKKEDSPFRKRGGRWVTTESEETKKNLRDATKAAFDRAIELAERSPSTNSGGE